MVIDRPHLLPCLASCGLWGVEHSWKRGVGPCLRGCWAGGASQSSARVTIAEGHLTRGQFDSTGERVSFSWAYCEIWRCLVACAKTTSIPIWLATSQPQNKQFLHHLPVGHALWRSEFLASPEDFADPLSQVTARTPHHLCGAEAQELWNEHSRGMEHSNTAPKGIQLPLSEFQVKRIYFPHHFSDVWSLMCYYLLSAMWFIYGLVFILGEVVIRSEEQCPKWKMW